MKRVIAALVVIGMTCFLLHFISNPLENKIANRGNVIDKQIATCMK